MVDDGELRLLAESVRGVVRAVDVADPDAAPADFWRRAGEFGWTDGDLPATAVYTIARELGAGGIFGLYADSIALASLLAGHSGAADVVAELGAGAAQAAFTEPDGGGARVVRSAWPAPDTRYGAVAGPGRLDIVATTGGRPVPTSAAVPAYALPESDVDLQGVASAPVSPTDVERARLLRDLIVCAQVTGAHRYLLSLTSDFAKTRVQFGHPIVEFQGLRHILVDVFSWLEAAELMLAEAFFLTDHHGAPPEQARGAVVFVRGKAWWALQRAFEVLGGVGFMTEHPLNHYTREMLVALAALGPADTHAETLAELIQPRAWLQVS